MAYSSKSDHAIQSILEVLNDADVPLNRDVIRERLVEADPEGFRKFVLLPALRHLRDRGYIEDGTGLGENIITKVGRDKLQSLKGETHASIAQEPGVSQFFADRYGKDNGVDDILPTGRGR